MPKYYTKELYDIEPKELEAMNYKDALTICKSRAFAKRANMVHEAQKIEKWQSDKEAMIKYLSKTIAWCEFKLGEME